MNTLQIYTRSYIRDNGTWDLSLETIESMKELLSKDVNNSISWVILVSNCQVLKSMTLPDSTEIKKRCAINKLINSSNRVALLEYEGKLSCSEARVELYRRITECKFRNEYLIRTMRGMPDFFMNLDSDDEIISHEDILAFVNHSDKIEDDLIGFGIKFAGGEAFSDEWTWDIDKFNYSRRYITTDTQTMFLFIHRYSVIEYVLLMRYFFTCKSVGDPNESCDDTLMALEISYGISKGIIFKIGALCSNLILYKIHPGQISEDQQSGYKDTLKVGLAKYGYLYVNSGDYYKVEDKNLVKFTPIKPSYL